MIADLERQIAEKDEKLNLDNTCCLVLLGPHMNFEGLTEGKMGQGDFDADRENWWATTGMACTLCRTPNGYWCREEAEALDFEAHVYEYHRDQCDSWATAIECEKRMIS